MTTPSPLLSLPGAGAGNGVDAPVAAHYGSFNTEQRSLENGEGVRFLVRSRLFGDDEYAALQAAGKV